MSVSVRSMFKDYFLKMSSYEVVQSLPLEAGYGDWKAGSSGRNDSLEWG